MQLQKEIADHELAEQMEEPMAQQLEADVNALQQKAQLYSKWPMRVKSGAIADKKEEIHRKVCSFTFLHLVFSLPTQNQLSSVNFYATCSMLQHE